MSRRARALSDPPRAFHARRRGRAAALFSCALFLGCAHTSDDEKRAREADRREVDLLKERVARLERQQSDNNAKLDRVLAKLEQKLEHGGDGDGARGAREQPRAPRAVVRVPEREAHDPGSAFHVTETVEISRGHVDEDDALATSTPSEGALPLVVDEAPSSDVDDDGGEPIVIDARAISALDARDAAPGSGSTKGRASAQTKRAPKDTRPPSHVDAGRAHEPPGRARAEAPTTKPPLAETSTSSNPKLVYKRAMQHFDEGRCDLAEQGFANILTRAPDHDLADNALYWTGVCRQRAGRLEEARQLFADVSLRYPSSNKLGDALFSLGEVNEAVGDGATARMYYTELVTRFPDSERAGEAKKNLARLERKGDKP